jgi:hypothetical protein
MRGGSFAHLPAWPFGMLKTLLQIFFSAKNPAFYPHKLGLMGAIYYNYGTL